MRAEFYELINQSLLSDQDKNLWKECIRLLDEKTTQDIFAAISNEEDLQFFTKNLKSKIVTLQDPDETKWNTIIEEQKIYLDNKSKTDLVS